MSLDYTSLLEIAELIELKAEIRAKTGDGVTAAAFFEVAEGLRALASDPDIPALTLTVPHGGPYKALAELAVALVSGHITPAEYVEAATAWIGRDIAQERARNLCATATA